MPRPGKPKELLKRPVFPSIPSAARTANESTEKQAAIERGG